MPKEKNLFLSNKKYFSGLVIPAHIALDQRNSLPEWISINRIDFFIDPVTYVLTEPEAKIYNKKRKIRRSYKKFIDSLGLGNQNIDFVNDNLPINYFINDNEFNNDNIKDFAEKFVRLQINVKQLDEETKNFIKILKEDKTIQYPINIALDSGHNPLFYTSPGFFFDSVEDNSFKLNVKLMELVNKLTKESECYGYLPIGEDFAYEPSQLKKLVENIPNGIKGIVLWFENFEDTRASEDKLRIMSELIVNLSKNKYKVINLYGGFFSALLCKLGCQGFSSGLCYDTHRSRAIEIGGGPLPFRYFVPEINKFLTQSDTEILYEIISPTCNCPVCSNHKNDNIREDGSLRTDEFVSSFFDYDSDIDGDFLNHEEDLKKHFIRSTWDQLSHLNQIELKSYLDEKQKIYQLLKENAGELIAERYAGHLIKWNNVLKEYL